MGAIFYCVPKANGINEFFEWKTWASSSGMRKLFCGTQQTIEVTKTHKNIEVQTRGDWQVGTGSGTDITCVSPRSPDLRCRAFIMLLSRIAFHSECSLQNVSVRKSSFICYSISFEMWQIKPLIKLFKIIFSRRHNSQNSREHYSAPLPKMTLFSTFSNFLMKTRV